MFARLATILAVGRRDAWRSTAIPQSSNEVRPPTRGRPVLACHWQIDPVSGRPVCVWHAEAAVAPAADATASARPALTLAASCDEPRRRHVAAAAEPPCAGANPPRARASRRGAHVRV